MVVSNESDFKKASKDEFKAAWNKDKTIIRERFEVGGRRLPHTTMLLLEKAYEIGFYSGLQVKIQYVENNG
jgi:hypothetical protein